MKNLLKYVIGALLFLCYFLAYTGTLSHIIHFHEQHNLFLFTEAYFNQQLDSVGFMGYLTSFIIQFFYYPVVGSALLALLITSVYPLTRGIIRKLFGTEDLLNLSIIPSLMLFFHTMEASHNLIPVTSTVLGLSIANLVLWFFRHHLPLIPIFKNLHITGKKLRIALTTITMLLYAGYGVHHFTQNRNQDERIMLKAEMHIKTKEWRKVLKYTRMYLNKGKTNQLISYFHHLALFHIGELPHRLFEYPQHLGAQSLYFPWKANPHESKYGHYIYEFLGHINEAQHWVTEAMVTWGETAPHLLNLTRYSIITHRPKVAQRFINKLKCSLFYRDEALQLEKIKEDGQVEGLKNVLSNVVDTPARFTNLLNIGSELEYICDKDPNNQMAFEYFMCHLLLANNIPRFIENLPRIHNFNYSSLPRAFEEALMVHRLKVGEEEFAKIGFTISENTESRFERYFTLTQNQQMLELKNEFSNSYWFYLNHINPFRKK